MNAITAGIEDGFLVGEPAWTNPQQRGFFLSTALSDRGVIELVARHYELHSPVSCSLFRRANNDAYVLMAGAQRFLLKIYRYNTRTREALVEEMTTANRLKAKGILVGTPVPRRDGELITEILVPEGLRHAVLFNWIRGEPPRYDESSVRKIGQAIARLHLAGRDIKTTAARPRLDLSRLFERPVACIQAQVANSPELTERLQILVRQLNPHIQHARHNLNDWGLCHGDCDPSNIYIAGQDVGFFDFDWCGVGWLPYDIATFRWAGLLAGLDSATLAPVESGYLDVRPEAAASMQTVPMFAVLRQLWIIEHILVDAACFGSFLQSNETLERQLASCERLALDLPSPG